MSDKVDKSIKRKMFAHEAADAPGNCPQCGQPLVQDYGPYQVATRSGKRLTDEFMMSGEFGYLCQGVQRPLSTYPNWQKCFTEFR